MKKNNILKTLSLPPLIFLLIVICFLGYTSVYYHAGEEALRSMQSDEMVSVTETDYGWLFDGPTEETALIFYPGAKVEETAYAPLLRLLAENGIDVCLVKVPLRIAFLAPNAAGKILEKYDYPEWYLGGHSMGGVVASNYAASHEDDFRGTILFASYPTKQLPDSQIEIQLVGTEDQVINRERLESSRTYAPPQYFEHSIKGGNHAQFGDYGTQHGDGIAAISPEEQLRETVDDIRNDIDAGK